MMPFASILVASSNESASRSMVDRLTLAGWPVTRIVPFDDLAWIAVWASLIAKLVLADVAVRRDEGTSDRFLCVDTRTSALLARDDVAILALAAKSGEIRLYEANHLDRDARRFPGHRELLDSGLLPTVWQYGCSLTVRNGRLHTLKSSIFAQSRRARILYAGRMGGSYYPANASFAGTNHFECFRLVGNRLMTLPHARQLILDPLSSFVDLIEAASVISEDSRSTLADLIACLDRGGEAATFASIALRRRLAAGEFGDKSALPAVVV